MKIRCLAVDDEAYATKIIADYIQKVPFLELAGTTISAIDALAQVGAGGIDLVFLDIQMPELTGMQFLKLCNNKCKVVLTTAYPEYALDGYEFDVVDYLLKPVAFERFLKAAQKAYTILNGAGTIGTAAGGAGVVGATVAGGTAGGAGVSGAAGSGMLMGTSGAGTAGNNPDYMFIKGDSKNKFIKVDYKDILYIEGLKNYVSVFTTGQRLITYQALRDLETVLPRPPFYRVHKSYIIPIDKIRMVDGNVLYIGEEGIPIGETYREDFFKLIREGE